MPALIYRLVRLGFRHRRFAIMFATFAMKFWRKRAGR